MAGLENPVSVQRDVLGIPTITADSTHDLFYAQGYVHAQDRFWEMDFRRHVTSGRVSELFGESQLGTDSFLRTLGWRVIAEQEVAAMDPTVLAYYEAYAEGVNAYLAANEGPELSLEYAVLGLQNADYEPEPWEPADSVAWLKAMAWDLRTNVEDETTRAILAQTFTPGQLTELYPEYPFDRNPVIVPSIATVAPGERGRGRSARGRCRHRRHRVARGLRCRDRRRACCSAGPARASAPTRGWSRASSPTPGCRCCRTTRTSGRRCRACGIRSSCAATRVSAECPFDVAGFGFSGVPGVIIGHNDRVAWGFTNLTTDVTDLYVEKVQGD